MLPIHPKKISSLIVERMGKDGASSHEEAPSELLGDREEHHAIAQDILGAISSKSAADLALALQAFFDQCQADDYSED